VINADDVLFVHQQKLIDFQLKNKNILFILDKFKIQRVTLWKFCYILDGFIPKVEYGELWKDKHKYWRDKWENGEEYGDVVSGESLNLKP